MSNEARETKVKAPPSLAAAADEALDVNMKPREASDLLFYLMFKRSIARHNGDHSQAAKSVGFSTSHFNVKLAVLEARFS